MDGWYDFRFQNVVYAPDRSPEISRMLSSILAGYAWDTENPFVAKSEQRLSALSEWVGQLETEYSELNLNRYSCLALVQKRNDSLRVLKHQVNRFRSYLYCLRLLGLVLIFVNSLSILPYKMPSESNRVQTALPFQLFL
ncbi:FAD-binding protein [Neisseria meningitidis]|nr:FAD-binding protein [Neisseria meningitidis]